MVWIEVLAYCERLELDVLVHLIPRMEGAAQGVAAFWEGKEEEEDREREGPPGIVPACWWAELPKDQSTEFAEQNPGSVRDLISSMVLLSLCPPPSHCKRKKRRTYTTTTATTVPWPASHL